MALVTGPFAPFFEVLGAMALLLIGAVLVVAVVLLVLTLASIRSGRLYFPRLLRPGLTALEGVMRALFKAVGLEDEEMLAFFVKLGNTMNARAFAEIPVAERAIFMPQCLRNAACPADLTPEGLRCKRCRRCTVGEAMDVLEGLGYRVFIVPGSSFIKRMVRKYRPRALIGVGCLVEVKEGLEMADKIGTRRPRGRDPEGGLRRDPRGLAHALRDGHARAAALSRSRRPSPAGRAGARS